MQPHTARQLAVVSQQGLRSLPHSICTCDAVTALPAARYWRDRATLMGGRLSLEAHSAKLRERHQVQAELRAWCEEVLEAQQQRQQLQHAERASEADEQQKAGVMRSARQRWVT
jgi:hypothetical protein